MSILAIDFGGTQLRAACFVPDKQGGLTAQRRHVTATEVQQGQQAVLERIIAAARAVIPPNESIMAVGVAAPGPLDARTGVIHHALTLPGWQDVPLAAIISAALGGVPTFIQNDASLGALAEYHQGAGQGCNPMLYMTISTGIGGGAIIDGKLFTGWRGLAIEPGHQRFTLPDGSIKRLEQLASGTALGEMAAARLQATAQPSSLRDVAHIDGKAVGQAALDGDALALEVVQAAGRWLGLGFANLVHLFNPRAIVLGGSVTQLGDLLLAPARRTLRAELLAPDFDASDLIRIAALRDDVCLVGAAYYALSLSE